MLIKVHVIFVGHVMSLDHVTMRTMVVVTERVVTFLVVGGIDL